MTSNHSVQLGSQKRLFLQMLFFPSPYLQSVLYFHANLLPPPYLLKDVFSNFLEAYFAWCLGTYYLFVVMTLMFRKVK